MTAPPELPELRFRAMGSDCHLVLHGDPALLTAGRTRIDQLERRWSRFLPDSEITALNAAAGSPVEVSDDTVGLVTRAIEGWRFTGGIYDPTVLGAMLRAGYDRSFDQLDGGTTPNTLLLACTDIEIEGNSITLPAGTGFDPGGIGKGLAADLVIDHLRTLGALGACCNMGGDVRAWGDAPAGGWTVAVQHARSTQPLAVVGVTDGAVASSTTLRRRWTVDGVERHHLIDPRTGEPADTDLDHVTVVAGSAWAAEVLAKAVLIRGSAHPWDLVDGTGAAALAVTEAGEVLLSADFERFCVGPLVHRLER